MTIHFAIGTTLLGLMLACSSPPKPAPGDPGDLDATGPETAKFDADRPVPFRPGPDAMPPSEPPPAEPETRAPITDAQETP